MKVDNSETLSNNNITCISVNKYVLTVKAAFHYCSKLQTWLSTCVSVSKARRKQVESMSKASRKPAASLLKT